MKKIPHTGCMARPRVLCSWGLTLCLLGCKEERPPEDWRAPPPTATAKPQPASPDRLPPGELMEGNEVVFGFPVPKKMEVTSPTRERRRLAGRVDFEQLTDYVRKRITARHAELRKDELHFSKVRIKGGDRNRVYDVTLRDGPAEQVVWIEDVTRPPATPGLTPEERWKRVGLKPHGGLIDPEGME